VTFLLNLSIFGGGVPNLVIAAQNIQIIGLKISNSNFDWSFCNWLIVLSLVLCPIMWLGSPRDMK